MKVICISSSMKYKEFIRETVKKFESIGIKALFPNLDGYDKNKLNTETMKMLCQDHFHAIDKAEALYVINPDSYIGTLVTIEIGYTLGKSKPVYYTRKTETVELDALSQDVIPMNSIERFCYL